MKLNFFALDTCANDHHCNSSTTSYLARNSFRGRVELVPLLAQQPEQRDDDDDNDIATEPAAALDVYDADKACLLAKVPCKEQQFIALTHHAQRQHQKQRRVRFYEANNVWYDCVDSHKEEDEEDCHAAGGRWYSAEEIHTFRNDVRVKLCLVRQNNDEDHPSLSSKKNRLYNWAKSLHTVYQAFCQVKTGQDLVAFLSHSTEKVVLDATGQTLGLEKRATMAMVQDTLQRRQQIRRLVFTWQQKQQHRDYDYCTHHMRNSSRAVSLPSRLFARHIAVMLAATLAKDSVSF